MAKESMPEQDLSPLELDIMQIVWASGRVTSGDILQAFDAKEKAGQGKSYERSTIGTYLDRLRLKKYLDREPGEGREFVYFPLVSKEQFQGAALKKLMATFGSESDLLQRFAGSAKL